jgi:serine/threonine protein kinase
MSSSGIPRSLVRMVKKVCKYSKDRKLDKALARKDYRTIIDKVSAVTLLDSGLPFLYVYYKDDILPIDKPFGKGEHMRICDVKDKPLVVKWYRSGDRTSQYEINVYKKLKSLGCPLPYFSGKYSFWNEPVLVMERLERLDKKEDINKLGRQVLIQLSYLHTFGVHCDIKPDNILKRVNDDKVSYFLIDYGGVAMEKLNWGYKRWIWSKHWTSQTPHIKKQIASCKHDFKELGFTLNALKNPGVNHREEFTGKIKKYMNRVEKVDKRKVDQKDYEDLIKILS